VEVGLVVQELLVVLFLEDLEEMELRLLFPVLLQPMAVVEEDLQDLVQLDLEDLEEEDLEEDLEEQHHQDQPILAVEEGEVLTKEVVVPVVPVSSSSLTKSNKYSKSL